MSCNPLSDSQDKVIETCSDNISLCWKISPNLFWPHSRILVDGFNHLYCSVEGFPCAPGYIVQIVGLAIWKTNRNFKIILSRQLDRPFTYQTLNDFRIYNYEIGEFRLVLVKDRQVQHDFTAESKCWAWAALVAWLSKIVLSCLSFTKTRLNEPHTRL